MPYLFTCRSGRILQPEWYSVDDYAGFVGHCPNDRQTGNAFGFVNIFRCTRPEQSVIFAAQHRDFHRIGTHTQSKCDHVAVERFRGHCDICTKRWAEKARQIACKAV